MLSILKKLAVVALMATVVAGCENKKEENSNPAETVKVGTIAGPETELMEVAKQVAKHKYNLDIEIVQFQDYATPNTAVADGGIDANAFQTVQYFEAAVATQKLDLVNVGKTFIYPMGLYSKKIKNLAELKEGAVVALPNDPSNEERGLLLVEKAGLIKLNRTEKQLTVNNISENPMKLKFITLDAAQLPRSLDDVEIAAINTNYAVEANLYPTKDALVVEGGDSPYVNIIVTRKALTNDPRILHLVAAYQSTEVIEKANELFNGQAIAGWVDNSKTQ